MSVCALQSTLIRKRGGASVGLVPLQHADSDDDEVWQDGLADQSRVEAHGERVPSSYNELVLSMHVTSH